jgi:hypothetical protein
VKAVITKALQILPSYRHRKDALVVINPRRLAVIFDKQAHRGVVMSVDSIEQVIEDQMKSNLQAWLTNPRTPFYVMRIAGSWFAGKWAELDGDPNGPSAS